MRKFPTRLKIGEHEYRVVLMDELEESKAGMCFFGDEKVIMVSARQSKEEIIATLLHEVLHAIEQEQKVKLGHAIINKIEHALADVFCQLLDLHFPKPRRKRG